MQASKVFSSIPIDFAIASPTSISRATYFIFPVSMYFALKAGKTSRYQRPHTGQATDAYSITVTGARGLPRLISAGSATAGRPQPAAPDANNPKTTARLLRGIIGVSPSGGVVSLARIVWD